MIKFRGLYIYLASIIVVVGIALMFFNIKAGLALYDAPQWLSPMEGDTFVSNADGTVTVNFAVYANEPSAGNQVRMYLEVIDNASSTPVVLDNGGYGSWVNSINSNIPTEYGTSTLAVKLDPIRKYRYVAWVVNDSGVTTTAPTPEQAIVPGSGFPPQSLKPSVKDENIVIDTSSNMVHAQNTINFKFLEAWTGVNGYVIDRKIVGEPTWVEGTTFYTYNDNRIILGHPNQSKFPDSECQSGRVCFSLNDPYAVEPNVVYQYRIRLSFQNSPSDPVITPTDGGKVVATSSLLVNIPTFDSITTVATSTHAFSSMRLYFHAPAQMNSYTNDGNPGFDRYEVMKIVNGVPTAPIMYTYDVDDVWTSSYFSCSGLFQCYEKSDLVLPTIKYQYLVRPCVTDNGDSRCADDWATSSELTALNYLDVPVATAIGNSAPTSTPAESSIRVHFRSQVALTDLPVTNYQLQVIENDIPRTPIAVIDEQANNTPGNTFFGAGLCAGNYRCFTLPTFSSTSADVNYRITPGSRYIFRVRLAYLGTSPYNSTSSAWIETSEVTAANLLPITLNPPSAVRAQVVGSNMVALALDYVYDPTFLSLIKTIPGYSALTGYEVNRHSSVNQIQFRTSASSVWNSFMLDGNYVQVASGTYVTAANLTIGDQANEIFPTSTPLTYFYVDPNSNYYFRARSINKYIVGQDSGYTESDLINMKPLPEANNVGVNRFDLTNYTVAFQYDFSDAGPTAFYVQWNTMESPTDPGWNTTDQAYVVCTTNVMPCQVNIYGLNPTNEYYFRVIPRGKLDNVWRGYVKATAGTIPNIAEPQVFSTSTGYSVSQININFNQPNSWAGFNRYEIAAQLGTWNGSAWTWNPTSVWNYSGTSTQNSVINNSNIESHSDFDSNTCNNLGSCFRVPHSNNMANPVVPGATYRYLFRLCTPNAGMCSTNGWVTSTPVTAPALVPIPNPETPLLTATSTYTKSKITLFFKYTGGWSGLSNYAVERQANGGVWTAVATYSNTQGATTSPSGCATANTCYSQTYEVTPSTTYAYRVRIYSATPLVYGNFVTSSPVVSSNILVAGMPTEPIFSPRSCFGEGCFDLHVRFSPTLIDWINRYRADLTYQTNYPNLYFDVRYKKITDTSWSWGNWFGTSWDHNYEDSSVYAPGKCTKSRECYNIPVDGLEPNQVYDVAISVYGYNYDSSWNYRQLVNSMYILGQVTTSPALGGEINAPKSVGIITDDIGSNVVKLKIDYDYQSSLPALYRNINTYDGLPEGYEITDRRWEHWLYTSTDGWNLAYPRAHYNQIQFSHNQSSWDDTGILIAADKYLTNSNTSFGDNAGELEYPNGFDYYYIDRPSGDTYLRANTINQYLTVAPPPKYQNIGWGGDWVDWNNSGTSPINISSTTYTQSDKVAGLMDFPSAVTLTVKYEDAFGNPNEWEAYLKIEYNYTRSGPTLYEIEQSDSPSPTSGWIDSSPGEYVCTSGVCVVHLTGLTGGDGKYRRFIRVRPKGTSVWMYKNDTVIWRTACTNISFANPTSTPGLAISASMVNEIRQKINICRANMGSSVGYYTFHNANSSDTDTQITGQGLNPMAANTRIRALHVLQIREAIEEMYRSFASDPTNLKYRVTNWPAFWNKDKNGDPLPVECQNLAVGSKICIKHFSVIRQLLIDLEK